MLWTCYVGRTMDLSMVVHESAIACGSEPGYKKQSQRKADWNPLAAVNGRCREVNHASYVVTVCTK
jgi:hypothetical protein